MNGTAQVKTVYHQPGFRNSRLIRRDLAGRRNTPHLGYALHEANGPNSGNNRNGHSTKQLKGDHDDVKMTTPQDCDGRFVPQIVRKGQVRLTQLDDQILSL